VLDFTLKVQIMNTFLIKEAAEYVLADGTPFGETTAGREVLRMAREYEKQRLETLCMPVNEFVARKEDMSANGRLRLIKQDDGDICVTVIPGDDRSMGIEFCAGGSGGGHSPRTLAALNALAIAMIEDNKAEPSRAASR
jgi:hypothetical protein